MFKSSARRSAEATLAFSTKLPHAPQLQSRRDAHRTPARLTRSYPSRRARGRTRSRSLRGSQLGSLYSDDRPLSNAEGRKAQRVRHELDTALARFPRSLVLPVFALAQRFGSTPLTAPSRRCATQLLPPRTSTARTCSWQRSGIQGRCHGTAREADARRTWR